MLLSYRYNHTIIFTNGSAASEESNNEDNGAQGYEKRGYREETIIEKMLILIIYSMDDHAN
jgi:hypothetical protein